MQKNKKLNGFTLTELAIVIAVIAVLIAVLVPTFISLINKSNNSADEQTVTNMNTALSVDEADSDTPEYLCEVWDILEDYGFSSPFKPSLTANTFYWYKTDNRILIYNKDDGEFTFPAEYTGMTIDNTANAGGAVTANAKVAAAAVTQISSDDLMDLTIDSSNVKAHESSFINNGSCTLCHTANPDVMTVDETTNVLTYVATSYKLNDETTIAITEVVIPEGVTTIGEVSTTTVTNIFGDSANDTVTSVTIPNTVTYISKSAFRNCTALTSIDIPDSVTTIAHGAFEGCTSLSVVNIGSGVTSINVNGMFDGCTALSEINVDDGNENYFSYNGVLYTGTKANPISLLTYPAAKTDTSYTIYPGVTSIENSAFSGATSLTEIHLADVRSIGNTIFTSSTSLETVYIEASFKDEDSRQTVTISATAFPDNTITTIYITGNYVSIGTTTVNSFSNQKDSLTTVNISGNYVKICDSNNTHGIFYQCTSLTTANITGTGTDIGGAFNGCSALANVNITGNGSLSRIGNYGFYNCKSLKSIDLSKTTEIGQYAFGGETLIENLDISNVQKFDTNAFYGCTWLTTNDLSGATYIGQSAFYGSGLTGAVKIGPLTYLGNNYAFQNCEKITSVEFDSASTFNHTNTSTFQGCTLLKSVILPASVKTIGGSSFKDCSALTTINLSNITKQISTYSFSGCTLLKDINLSNVPMILRNAFENCTSLTSVDLSSVTDLREYVFSGCTSLASVILSEDLTEIKESTFYGCTTLESVDLSNVNTIGASAFSGCTSLESVVLNAKSYTAYEYDEELDDDKPVTAYVSIGTNAFDSVGSLTVYVYGTSEEWTTVENYTQFNSATVYYYAEDATGLTESGTYWYYDNGDTKTWTYTAQA